MKILRVILILGLGLQIHGQCQYIGQPCDKGFGRCTALGSGINLTTGELSSSLICVPIEAQYVSESL